jgi:hypothetical protein
MTTRCARRTTCRPTCTTTATASSGSTRPWPAGPCSARVVAASLAELTAPYDLVDVFRRPDAAAGAPGRAGRPAPRRWCGFQLGIRHDAVAAALTAAGKTVIQDRCTLADHRRLGPGAASAGRRPWALRPGPGLAILHPHVVGRPRHRRPRHRVRRGRRGRRSPRAAPAPRPPGPGAGEAEGDGPAGAGASPAHRQLRPGEAAANAVKVPADWRSKLATGRCACGEPLALTSDEAIRFDGRLLVVVRLACAACGHTRSVYLEPAAA